MSESKSWQRARSAEQKEQRASLILEAAAELLDEHGLEGTGLNAIARKAGLSKPNLYVYFESREAILLSILLNENAIWIRSFCKKLEGLKGSNDVESVAKAFADSLSRRKRYCVLFNALATVFEQNVGAETIASFKRDWLESWGPMLQTFSEVFEGFSIEQSYWCVGTMTLFSASIWGHCHPSEAVKKVYEMDEFCHMKKDFKESVQKHAVALLYGELSLSKKS